MHKVDTNILKLIPFYVGSNISSFDKELMTISSTQHVDKNCPFQIYNYLFKSNSQLEQSLNHQGSIIQSILIKGFRWLNHLIECLNFDWMIEFKTSQNLNTLNQQTMWPYIYARICYPSLVLICATFKLKSHNLFCYNVKHMIQWFKC